MKRACSFSLPAFCFLLSALCLLIIAAPANASFISLKTAVSSRYDHGRLTVIVSAQNKGDESAYNVQWEFRLGSQRVMGDKIPELPVGATMRTEKKLPFQPDLPGTYPLALITHYTDANQYPFSALSLQTFVYRDAGYPPVSGLLGSATFDREGRLEFKAKNAGQGVIKARVMLIAPVELTVANNYRDIIIEPGNEQGLSFTVKNFSALAGSTYQLFAATEYEDGGLHYSVITPGQVKVVARQAILGLDPTIYIAALALLLLLFIGAQLLRKK
jgi:hypothetical protein